MHYADFSGPVMGTFFILYYQKLPFLLTFSKNSIPSTFPHFKVQMIPSGVAGIAHQGNHLSLLNLLSRFHKNRQTVGVQSFVSFIVPDLYMISVPRSFPAGVRNDRLSTVVVYAAYDVLPHVLSGAS